MAEYLHNGAPIVGEELQAIHVDHRHDQMESINKMSRFPVSMREFCKERDYIVPKAVAVGPYHHGLPELQEMEGVKEAAAHVLKFTQPLHEAYKKVFDVSGVAWTFYDDNALQGIRKDTFASMMFHDACFLLLTILAMTRPIECNAPLLRQIGANINVLLRDIFLLENQIPWIVLKALMDITEAADHLDKFIATMGMSVQSRLDRRPRPLELENHRPPHLLGLFHFYQSGRRFMCTVGVNHPTCQECNVVQRTRIEVVLESLPLSTSAIELAEIGIKLTPSKTAELKDIKLTKGILFRKLLLPSLHLNENTACWLLNMAAFETCMASHDCTVSSYLALFAMLMDREEDVHELRSKHLIHGEFTNKQVLDFFKGRQASNICPGHYFYEILRSLETYRQKRWVWIAIHRFVYKNIKIILTVLSVIGIVAAILKATPLLKSIS